MTRSGDGVSLEVERSLKLTQHGPSHLNESPILPFSYTILLRGIHSRTLVTNSLFTQKHIQGVVLELSAIVTSCNIPSFQNSEKSEKFKTFSNYMYFTLKRNFMHCMHHHLVLFAFVCFCLFKRLEYNFLIQNLLDKILCLGFILYPIKYSVDCQSLIYILVHCLMLLV